MSKLTEAELKARLHTEYIGNTTYYYSIVKKEAKTFSIMSNERLLIYDETRRILFYNNDCKNLPFVNNIPKPKNDVSTPIQTSTFKNPSNSQDIQVRYTGKNPKGEMETVEWNFTCETQQLAKEWMTLLEKEKDKIVAEQTGQKGGAFIHDALMEAVRKETILKPEEQVIKTAPYKQESVPYKQESVPYKQESVNNSSFKQQPRQPAFNYSYMDRYDNAQSQQISRFSALKPEVQQPRQQPNLQQSQVLMDLPLLGSKSGIRTKSQIERQSRAIMDVSEVKRIDAASQLREQSKHRSFEEERKSSVKTSFNDWNMKFLRNPHESTLSEFQLAANHAFLAAWPKDTPLKGGFREHESEGLQIRIANLYSEEAKILKRQFRNYHFILQSCKTKLVIGVPMTCLIEWQGVVALVKAPLPRDSPKMVLNKVVNDLRELQRYTRVGNSVLESATLIDTTQAYSMNGDKRLIFVDNLTSYIPFHVDQELTKTTLRPQFLLDTVTQLVPGGEVKPSNRTEWKTLTTVCQSLTGCLRELVLHLNSQQTLWANALDLKDIFHSFGVNMKLLPRVYSELSSKYVKRQVMSVMAAKVAKEMVGQAYMTAFSDGQQESRVSKVEEIIRYLIEGNNSNSSDSWKALSINFKKQFGIPLNNSEIQGGFFLNSLIRLLHIDCDVSLLNKTKRIFKEEGIIQPGFVLALLPKSKTYYRFTTELMEKLQFANSQQQKDQQIYQEVIAELRLDSNPLPPQFSNGVANQCILEYLSYYTPPKALDSEALLRHIPIYASIFSEPPSAFSLRLTRTYLEWSIKKEKSQEFKRGVQNALKIADYWLDETHIYHSSLYQLLSDYYLAAGNPEESVNFMKEALSRCIRVCGAQSKHAGGKYFDLGERQLKAGCKREALESFSKARSNMEVNRVQTLKYPQLMFRVAAVQLNCGNVQACIEDSLEAIRQFEEYDRNSGSGGLLTEEFKIKTFQLLERAYEVGARREELRDMTSLCAKKFNRSKKPEIFQLMLRVCLAATIFRHPIERCEDFAELVRSIPQESKRSAKSSLQQLMLLSEEISVMESFASKFESLSRVITEGNSKRGYSQESKDFLRICGFLRDALGEDFIEGLVHQKQYE